MSTDVAAADSQQLPNATDLGFDPADPAFIADPYPTLTRMRDAGPAVAYPEAGLTLLTRFADVNAALRERRLGRDYRHLYTDEEFEQRRLGAGLSPRAQVGADPRWPRWNESERWSLLNLEPPDHTRLRRLITKVFTAKAVQAMRPQVEAIAAQRLDPLAGSEFDLIASYAQPFSVNVICTLLGVPLADGHLLLDWSHAIVKMYEMNTSLAEMQAADRAADEFISYVSELIEQRRAHGEDDLITELVEVSDNDGEGVVRLSVDEIICTVIVLLNAGHEATVNTLGNGMRAMLTHPDQWQRVVSGEVPALTAVEEMLRWDAPLQLFERWVLQDGIELGGRTFAAGERIGMLFGSANRDPLRFPDADTFDVARGESTHIGFGGGLHFCIGAPLARLEVETSLNALRALPGLELAEMPSYQPYFVIRGLKELRLSS